MRGQRGEWRTGRWTEKRDKPAEVHVREDVESDVGAKSGVFGGLLAIMPG